MSNHGEMRICRFASFAILSAAVGCSAAAQVDGELEAAVEVGKPDAKAPDAKRGSQSSPISAPEDAGDTEPTVDAGVDAEPVVIVDDAGTVDAAPDAGDDEPNEPVDAGSHASPDAGKDAAPVEPSKPCVEYLRLPQSPYVHGWAVYPEYSSPWYCPDATVANSCRSRLMSLGAVQSGSSYRLYPVQGACRMPVPDKCLPCTAGATEW